MAKTDAELESEAIEIRDETAEAANTATRVGGTIKDIVDAKINKNGGGAFIIIGTYDASNENYPSTGGTGGSGEVLKGNVWVLINSGTYIDKYGDEITLDAGSMIMALTNSPGQTPGNWARFILS